MKGSWRGTDGGDDLLEEGSYGSHLYKICAGFLLTGSGTGSLSTECLLNALHALKIHRQKISQPLGNLNYQT